MSLIVDLAEAVATNLNTATFSQPFIATREYNPRQAFEAMGDNLSVFIIPRSMTPNFAGGTRAETPATLTVLVAIYKRIGIDSTGKYVTAEVDAMYDFVEELTAFFLNNIEQGNTTLESIGNFNSLLSDAEKLETQHLFESVLKIDFATLMGE